MRAMDGQNALPAPSVPIRPNSRVFSDASTKVFNRPKRTVDRPKKRVDRLNKAADRLKEVVDRLKEAADRLKERVDRPTKTIKPSTAAVNAPATARQPRFKKEKIHHRGTETQRGMKAREDVGVVRWGISATDQSSGQCSPSSSTRRSLIIRPVILILDATHSVNSPTEIPVISQGVGHCGFQSASRSTAAVASTIKANNTITATLI
jgi:hypothetical protein